MRKRNFNIAPYFNGIPTQTIKALIDELWAHLNDETRAPTDSYGEELPKSEQIKIFDAYSQLIIALNQYTAGMPSWDRNPTMKRKP